MSINTPYYDYYNEVVLGYELNYSKFLNFYSEYSDIYIETNLNTYLDMYEFNNTIHNLPHNVKFYFDNNRFILGYKLIEYNETMNTFSMSIFEDLPSYVKILDDYIENFPKLEKCIILGLKSKVFFLSFS